MNVNHTDQGKKSRIDRDINVYIRNVSPETVFGVLSAFGGKI
jgi:hypothetical protein